MKWFDKINFNYAIPAGFVFLGGFCYYQIQVTHEDIISFENISKQSFGQNLGHKNEHSPSEFAADSETSHLPYNQQPGRPEIRYSNMYPQGHPNYNDFTLKIRKQWNGDLLIDEDFDLTNSKAVKKSIPDSIRLNPLRKKEMKQNLLKDFQKFDENVRISTKVVQEAINSNSRSEKEIQEALEAIEKMKEGRQLLYDDFSALQDSESNIMEDEKFEVTEEK